MKLSRIFAYLFNLYSMSAVAGYECHLKLAHSDDLYKTISEKSISIEANEMSSGNMGSLVAESDSVSLQIDGMMNGWRGDEDAEFVIYRGELAVSEVMQIGGDNSLTAWFDNYMLDIKCETNE